MIVEGSWFGAILAAVLLSCLVMLPGGVALRLLGVRPVLSLALGPALTAATLGTGGIVLRELLVDYTPVTAALTVTILWLVALALRPVLHIERTVLGRPLPEHARSWWPAVVAVVVAVAIQLVPLALRWGLLVPSERADAIYHYNALNAISETGTVSMFGAMNFNYGLRTLSIVYPSVWHALAVFPSEITGPVVTANVFAHVVTPLVFCTGFVILVRTLFPQHAVMTVVVPVLSAGYVAFPHYMVVGKAFWPNALAVAMVPGVLAGCWVMARQILRGAPAPGGLGVAGILAVLLASFGGVGLTHPTLLFSLVFVLLPLLGVVGVRLVRDMKKRLSRRRFGIVVATGALIPLVAAMGLLAPPRVRSFLSREIILEWSGALGKYSVLAFNWPLGTNPLTLLAFSTLYLPLLCTGIIAVWRRHELRWIIWAWLTHLILICGTLFPIPILSNVGGLWYSDPYRLLATQSMFLSILLGAALVCGVPAALRRVASSRSERWRRRVAGGVTATIVIVHVGLAGVLMRSTIDDAGTAGTERGMIATDGELEMLQRLDDTVGEGAVIIGDPASGVAFAPLYSEAESVFTQLNRRSVDIDGNYLSENFDKIGEDPLVCRMIHHYGIRFFYHDTVLDEQPGERGEQYPGFYAVDTTEGFTVVDRGGDARLYRIDACGTVQPKSNWWDGRSRRFSVVEIATQPVDLTGGQVSDEDGD